MSHNLYDFNPYEDYFGNDAGTGDGAADGGAAANGGAANGAAAASGGGNGGPNGGAIQPVLVANPNLGTGFKLGSLFKRKGMGTKASASRRGGMDMMGMKRGGMGARGRLGTGASPEASIVSPLTTTVGPTTTAQPSVMQAGFFGDIPLWMILAIAGAAFFFMFRRK